MKKKAPFKVYCRYVEGGQRISVGEYVRAKWNNIMNPFKLTDESSLLELATSIKEFKKKQGREVEIVGYRGCKSEAELKRLLEKYL